MYIKNQMSIKLFKSILNTKESKLRQSCLKKKCFLESVDSQMIIRVT